MVFHYPQQTTLLCKTRIIGHMPTPSPHGASSKHGVQIGFSITSYYSPHLAAHMRPKTLCVNTQHFLKTTHHTSSIL
jgi:hypothetical protein